MKRLFVTLIFSLFAISSFATTIYDVQYTEIPGGDNTYPSPYEGQEVTVTGIVTAIGWAHYLDNFYMSMPAGGEWSGILVYMAEDTTLVPGDEVEITGTVQEYYGLTEISGYSGPITVNLLSSGNPIPDPVVVTCGDLAVEGVGEPYEGCLIELHDVTVVEEQINFGQWYVMDGTGIAQIDDGFFYLDEIEPPIVITLGMEWAIIRGCLDYSYDEYGLSPRTPDDLIDEVSTEDYTTINSSRLIGNFPNPFNPVTTIQFTAEDVGLRSTTPGQAEHTELIIYNLKGQKVKTLLNEKLDAGYHSVVWDGKDDTGKPVTSGIYFYKLQTKKDSSMKKMILLR
jgi:hypothetical protein